MTLPTEQRHGQREEPFVSGKDTKASVTLTHCQGHPQLVPPAPFQALRPATHPLSPWCEISQPKKFQPRRPCWGGFLPREKTEHLAQDDGGYESRNLKKSLDKKRSSPDHALDQGMHQAALVLGETEKLLIPPRLSVHHTRPFRKCLQKGSLKPKPVFLSALQVSVELVIKKKPNAMNTDSHL